MDIGMWLNKKPAYSTWLHIMSPILFLNDINLTFDHWKKSPWLHLLVSAEEPVYFHYSVTGTNSTFLLSFSQRKHRMFSLGGLHSPGAFKFEMLSELLGHGHLDLQPP